MVRLLFSALAAVFFSLALPIAKANDGAAQIIKLDIASQPLGSALNEFGRQSGLQVVFFYGDVAQDLTAPQVKGRYTAEAALAKLLANTNLRFKYLNERTIAIRSSGDIERASDVSAVSASPSELRLAQPQVSENTDSNTAVGRVQDSSAQSTGSPGNKIQEIVVTAQKREERLQDVPISISVLGGSDLDNSTFTGVMDALNTVPGIATFGSPISAIGGGMTLTMRGVGPSSASFNGSSPIGYYLDSVPFGLIKTALLPDAGAFDLDRVEVLRGPQGTLYGASSENGLVRVLTKDADLNEFQLKARTTGSSTDGADDLSYGADVAVNLPIVEGKLAVRAVAGYEDLAGWIDAPSGEDINDSKRNSYRLKVNAQPTDSLSLGLSAWSNRLDQGAPSNSNDDMRRNSIIDAPISNDYDVYGFKLGYDFSNFSVTNTAGYLEFSGAGIFDYGGVLTGQFLYSDLRSKVLSDELIFSSKPGSAWKWTAGAFFRRAEDRLVQSLSFLPSLVIDLNDRSNSYAGFGEFGRRFAGDKFEWALGARYFHDDVLNRNNDTGGSEEVSFNSISPRGVLTWYPTENVTVYGSYSEGFRSGFPQNYGFVPADFPSVKPDELRNYEIGVKADAFDNRFYVDAAIYYIDWRDVQQTILVGYNGIDVTAPLNGESASGMGVDLSLIARPTAALELGVTGSWNGLAIDNDVRVGLNQSLLFSEGDRLITSPEYTFGAWTEYVAPLGAGGYMARLSVSANYTSELTTRAAGIPSARVFNGDTIVVGRVRLAIDSPQRWSAAIFADNFNNNYGALTMGLDPTLSPRVRPRTIGVQLEYRY